MKKLWVIAMSLISSIALAQHDQKQTPTGSKSSQESKSKTTQSSSYSADEGTIEGTYQIIFTAKAARPEDKGQSGMNSMNQGIGINNNKTGKGIQQSTGVPSSQNQSSKYGTSTQQSNMGTPTSPSSQYNSATTSPTMGTSSSQTQNQLDKNEGTGVIGQEGTGNQSMGNTSGTQNQSVQSGSYNQSPSMNDMQANASGTGCASLSGKKMILTLRNGKIEISDKEKSKSESTTESKSKTGSDADVSTDNSSVSGNTMQMQDCNYTKTSGSGSNCTITASCKDNSNIKSYWSAFIMDGSKINGSVSFVTAGSGSSDYSFTGTRVSGSSKRNTNKDTSQR